MPVSMTPYRVFPDYRHIDPAFFTRHGIRLLLCDLDYTLAPSAAGFRRYRRRASR